MVNTLFKQLISIILVHYYSEQYSPPPTPAIECFQTVINKVPLLNGCAFINLKNNKYMCLLPSLVMRFILDKYLISYTKYSSIQNNIYFL